VRRLRDALVVAEQDLAESLRSRKALVLLGLYLAGALAACGIFVRVLQEVEGVLADTLRVSRTERPGAMTQRLMESDELHRILRGLIGDADLAIELVQIPPMALFYGWVALTFVPPLVALTSGDAVANELSTGSARFAFFRTDRTSWAVGKLLGQGALLGVGVGLGGVGAFIVGWSGLLSFEPGPNALWLLRLGLRAWVYGLAWLGIVMGAGQLTRSVPKARGLALGALVLVGTASVLLGSDWVLERAPVIAPTVHQLLPGAHQIDLWRPEIGRRAVAVVVLLALGGGAFALGHQRLLRVDA
jgi:hypothetical protein